MSYCFWMVLSYFLRGLLSLRYRIEVRGLDQLTPERLNRKEGTLFLPNHPAHMDPLINFVWLWPRFRMRPLVLESLYQVGFLRPVFRMVGALPIPNFETAVNELKVRKGEQSMREIAAGLKRGERFAVYPSGRLKSTGKELIGGAAAAYELLKECPDANVVLIRTTGLWGSSFSRAFVGRSPELKETVLHAAKALLKNGLFFLPRRHVLIEMVPNPEDLPRARLSRI